MRKGLKMSDETKKKIGDAQRGAKNHFYGKKLSDEQKRKISESNKGKKIIISEAILKGREERRKD